MDRPINRRTFMRNCLGTAALVSVSQLAVNRLAFAEDLPMLDEKDPMAVQLGFVSDATRADKAKYPKYEAGQQCSQCIFYTAGESAATGPCGVFAGKSVPAGGWCSTWTKRA